MRTLVRAAAATWAALVALGCTDGEVTRPEAEPVTTGRLAQSTVGPRDLSGAFEQETAVPGIEGEVVADHRCDDAVEELEPTEQVTAASTDGEQQLVSVVAWFPGAGNRPEGAFRRAQSACRSASRPGGGMAVRAGPLDLGPISDDVHATLFEVERQDGSIRETAVVLVRRGDLVSLLRLTGPRPVSRTLLDQATRVAISRLTEAARTTDA